MKNFGFVKVAAAVPQVRVAECESNVQQIERLIEEAESKGVQVVVFPELSITGCTCGDLFGQRLLLEAAEKALYRLLENTRKLDVVAIVGMPIVLGSALMNCAVVVRRGRILGVVPKNDSEETEICLCGQTVAMGTVLFANASVCFGVAFGAEMEAIVPQSSHLAQRGADIVFSLSAMNEQVGKHAYVLDWVRQQSARCVGGYVVASAGFGESSTDGVFAGNGIVAENGTTVAQSERFAIDAQLVVGEIDVEALRHDRMLLGEFESEQNCIEIGEFEEIQLTRKINPTPFVPSEEMWNERCAEVFDIQSHALAVRLRNIGIKSVVVGISGGLDSTLALLVCVRAFDKLGLSRKGIVGITMPGFGTTDRTYNNALKMMTALGIAQREISIKEACVQHFKDIEHDINTHDVTYENSQARERTQVLMDVANQLNALVIGTGDLSELALGWATYNGDHMSMYGVNADVPKTLVRHLVTWFAQTADEDVRQTLLDVVDTPISPELIPADAEGNIKQKTEDLVGPYELHDFFLYYLVRYGFCPAKIYFLAKRAFAGVYSNEEIKKWLTTFCRRFFQQQFKRSCMPDGPRVGSVSLSPRGAWRMPSDASAALWLRECENLD